MPRRSFLEMGLPLDGSTVRMVLFNPAAATLVALVGSPNAKRAQRVFLRPLSTDGYVEVTLPMSVTVRHALVASDAPVLFVLVELQNKVRQVYSVALPNGELTPLAWRSPASGVERWIAELICASGDGHTLYVVSGARPHPEPSGGYSVDYDLCKWTPAMGTLEVLDSLAMPFV